MSEKDDDTTRFWLAAEVPPELLGLDTILTSLPIGSRRGVVTKVDKERGIVTVTSLPDDEDSP